MREKEHNTYREPAVGLLSVTEVHGCSGCSGVVSGKQMVRSEQGSDIRHPVVDDKGTVCGLIIQ